MATKCAEGMDAPGNHPQTHEGTQIFCVWVFMFLSFFQSYDPLR